MPYHIVAPPPPARREAVAARVSERLRQRVGALLGLAVALALVAATAAVFLPRVSFGTGATTAAERRGAAQATGAMRARGIAQHADRDDRSVLEPTGAASSSAAAKRAAALPGRPSSASDSYSSPAAPRLSSTAGCASSGIAWGTSVMRYGGESYAQAWTRDQQQLAPDIVRYYIPGTAGPRWPTTTGSMPLVISFRLLPADVLSGARDAQLTAFFAATPRLTYWSYWHEPEDDIARGTFTAGEYRAAWAHIARIARASGKPLRATLILMGYTAQAYSHRTWSDYYPGSSVVDVLAWDAYAWNGNDTPESVYGPAQAASAQAGKPWAIAETGVSSVQVPDGARRQALLTAMSHYLATAQQAPSFVTYFDSDPAGDPAGFQSWNISHDPAAAAAWRAGQCA